MFFRQRLSLSYVCMLQALKASMELEILHGQSPMCTSLFAAIHRPRGAALDECVAPDSRGSSGLKLPPVHHWVRFDCSSSRNARTPALLRSRIINTSGRIRSSSCTRSASIRPWLSDLQISDAWKRIREHVSESRRHTPETHPQLEGMFLMVCS